MYFASAFNQFGVDLFLEHFVATAAPPGPAKARGNIAALIGGDGEGDGSESDGGEGAAAAAAAAASSSGGALGSGAGVEGLVAPDAGHFTGLVFKLQSNMDPRHRDKVRCMHARMHACAPL